MEKKRLKVAIIGAGLAGLSCAHELERHDIETVIFEQNSYIGERMSHVAAMMQLLDRPVKNPIDYIKSEFKISLKPLNFVNRIVHYSSNKKLIIKGDNLGFLLLRSKDELDLKVQLYSQLKNTKILFNKHVKYHEIQNEYDYVVIASGESSSSKEMGCWIEWFTSKVKGAVILGDFDPNAIYMWVNKDYCREGYAYLTPFSKKRACIALIVPNTTQTEIEHYWQSFLLAENINNVKVEEFGLEHPCGYVYPHKVDNIYFAGITGGSIDPLLGFGILNSITMGAMAGRSIATGEDYEHLIDSCMQKNKDLYEFRKAYNKLSNRGLDALISFIGLPIIKQLIYFTPINIVNTGGNIIRFLKTKKKH